MLRRPTKTSLTNAVGGRSRHRGPWTPEKRHPA